jgi:hypothetical protein
VDGWNVTVSGATGSLGFVSVFPNVDAQVGGASARPLRSLMP